MRLSFFVRLDQMEWANQEAWRQHMTRSQWFREIIDHFMDTYEQERGLAEAEHLPEERSALVS